MKDSPPTCDYISVPKAHSSQISQINERNDSEPCDAMKQKRRFSHLVALALLANLSSHTYAQTWELLLPNADIGPATAGYPNILLNPLSAEPASPGIFVGQSAGSGAASLYRLTPAPPPASPYTVEPLNIGLETVRRLGYCANDGTPFGTIYAVGSGTENRASVWKVCKSEAGGDANTWSNDGPSFALKRGAHAIATGVTADIYGNAYSCGWASDGRGRHWVVRRKIPGGVWTTVSDLKAAGSGDALANGIAFCPQGGNNPAPAVIAVGHLNSKWTVVRSLLHGASGSWQTVDSWSPDSKTAATATDAVCDSAGNIYVVGARGTWDSPKGWVVRMSADGGATWTTVLDAAEGSASWAFAVAVDGDDNLWISGMTLSASGTPRWTTLKNSVAESWTASWASRQCPLGDTMSSKGRGIAGDAFGNVFAAGEIFATSPASLGLLRLVP